MGFFQRIKDMFAVRQEKRRIPDETGNYDIDGVSNYKDQVIVGSDSPRQIRRNGPVGLDKNGRTPTP